MKNIDECIKSYRTHKNLKIAADELGIKFQTLYVILRDANEPVNGDKSRYGSETDKFAAKGEALFKSLVPEAVDMNKTEFQSKCDFIFHGHMIDIKSSSLRKADYGTSRRRWAFSIKKQRLIADFLVCFAFDQDKEFSKCLLIPGDVAKNHGTISLPERGGKWADYLITIDDLVDFFQEIKSVSPLRGTNTQPTIKRAA